MYRLKKGVVRRDFNRRTWLMQTCGIVAERVSPLSSLNGPLLWFHSKQSSDWFHMENMTHQHFYPKYTLPFNFHSRATCTNSMSCFSIALPIRDGSNFNQDNFFFFMCIYFFFLRFELFYYMYPINIQSRHFFFYTEIKWFFFLTVFLS